MTPKRLENIQKLSDAIRNFKECYTDCELWGSYPDGNVTQEVIMTWLIENPHMAEIAQKINKLDT